jgi:glycosyltransferase involved in cell wall biosynthesis
MRVLTAVEPGRDGVFRHVEALVDHLLDRGIEVDLAFSSRRACADLFELVERVRAADGEAIDLAVGNAPSLADIAALSHLRRLIRTRRPDVVHGHSSKAGALVRLLAAFEVGPVYLYTPHAYFGLAGDQGPKAQVFNAAERAFRGIGTTIHVSEDENRFAREVLGVDPSRTVILPHGVDVDRFAPCDLHARGELRRSLSLPVSAPVIGTMARMGPQKDYPTFHRVIERVLEARPDVHVLQVGTGPLRDEAEARVRALAHVDRVHRIEEMNDAARFHRACDLVLLTSTYEAGIPYVALEALAVGLPLVITEAPGLRGLLAEAFSHIGHAAIGDDENLAAATLSLLESVVDGGVATNHRARVLERFERGMAFDRIVAFYEERLAHQR